MAAPCLTCQYAEWDMLGVAGACIYPYLPTAVVACWPMSIRRIGDFVFSVTHGQEEIKQCRCHTPGEE